MSCALNVHCSDASVRSPLKYCLQCHFAAGIKKHPEWELEKTIDSNEFSEWLSNNFNVALGFSILYMAAVFGGKRYMENKPRCHKN